MAIPLSLLLAMFGGALSALGDAPAPPEPAAKLLAAARDGTLDPAMLQTAWDAGDPELRQSVLRVWLEFPLARAWKPDPAVLAHDPDPGVRLLAARALGQIPEGIGALADLATQEGLKKNPTPPIDAKTRAAIVGSIAGRHSDFVRSLIEYTQSMTPGLREIFTGTGRCFDNLAELREALEKPPTFAGTPADLTAALTALIQGLNERTARTHQIADLADLFPPPPK